MIIIADTSAIYAAFDAGQAEHEAAARVLSTENMLISPMVMTELDHLTHRDLGFTAARKIVNALLAGMSDGQYRLAALHPDDLVAAERVRSRYEHLQLDLADAVGVVLAATHRTNQIFTLDQRDFRAITPLTAGFDAFRLLPMDA